MRVITAGVHRVLDFVTVVAFAIAPAVLGLTGFPATLAYLLAVVHLAMTILTRFGAKSTSPLPLPMHGAVEGVVGVVLLALPWLLGWVGTARTFYVAAGAIILIVWATSQYRAPNR